jgi:pimeloyl-ACP methyl ester carboxylesterase
MQHKELRYNNSTIMYGVAGSGAPVVLLHGFGEDSFVWQQLADDLHSTYKVIVPLLPGSSPSEAVEDMSMEGLARAVNAILEEEGIGQCVLIGHSMGGYITLAFAELFPRKLKGFGLFHSSAYADSAEKVETRRKGIKFIEQHGALEFLKTSVPNLYSPTTKERCPSLIEQHLQKVQGLDKSALIAYYEAMIARPDRTHILKQTPLPVLFVLGTHDTAVPIKDGLEQSHLPQLSYVHILTQSGHMGMLEEAQKSNSLLHEFLSATLQHHDI